MEYKKYILGIDTSNYKTSVAVTDLAGNIVSDTRKLLQVKQGERGLRQSHALFQHIDNIPALLNSALKGIKASELCAVSVSTKPRPVADSYMPVFNAGKSTANTISAILDIPLYEFSHQEGHIEAVRSQSVLKNEPDYLAYHLSGGTCELLKITSLESPDSIEIIGGSKDISFGQVIDRVGVLLGLNFPAGEEMDRMALASIGSTMVLTKIPVAGLNINLSGIETQCSRVISASDENLDRSCLINELFTKIAKSIEEMTINAVKETDIHKILFVGGVSGSIFISDHIRKAFENTETELAFGTQSLSQDNAVGIALLGGKAYGHEAG